MSRNDGHGAYRGNVEATDGFVDEYRTALGFLTVLANEVGLNVEELPAAGGHGEPERGHMSAAAQSRPIGTDTEKLPHVDGHAAGILAAVPRRDRPHQSHRVSGGA